MLLFSEKVRKKHIHNQIEDQQSKWKLFADIKSRTAFDCLSFTNEKPTDFQMICHSISDLRSMKKKNGSRLDMTNIFRLK